MARLIYIPGTLTHENGKDMVDRLYDFNNQNQEQPIHVLIDSLGGAASTCLALFELFSLSVAPIYTYALGSVFSAGLIIFLAGEKRYATKNCMFLAHPPQLSTDSAYLSLDEMSSRSDWGRHLQKTFIKLLVENSTMDSAGAKDLVSRDTFFYLKEAQKYGIVTDMMTQFPTTKMFEDSQPEIITPSEESACEK